MAGTPHVKICGMTRPQDAALAASLGARYVGLVFWPNSPRAVTVEQAAAVVAALPDDVEAVGVFVDETPERSAAIAREAGLALLQLHGDERPESVEAARAASGLPVIKAVRVAERVDLEGIARDAGVADFVLLDTKRHGLPGGTGETFDWSLLAGVDLSRVFLAGGLRPDNVAAAAALTPYALDVSSGVEAAPGQKEAELLRRLFEALRC